MSVSVELFDQGYVCDKSTGVWVRETFSGIAYSDGDEIETRVARIIAGAADLSVLSPELRQHCTDWPSLYHLSGTRANIIRPLAAELQGVRVLEIGAGCGAITRYLGEAGAQVLALEGSVRRASIVRSRTRDLDNVTVVADRFADFATSETFDLITLIGVFEYANLFSPGEDPAGAMLRRIRQLLKPGGKLVIAIENQLGLKYFMGAPEDHLGEAMYGLENRYQRNQPQTFGRLQLERIVRENGFVDTHFFLPFPDYKLPESIVSEMALAVADFDASAFAWQSVRHDHQLPAYLNFSPELVWPVLFNNGIALDLANSFLLVAETVAVDNAYPVLAYHFSTGRKPAYCKETLFKRRGDGSIGVFCQQLSGAKSDESNAIIRYLPLPESDYVYGTPMSQELVKIFSKHGWQIDELVGFFIRYRAVLVELMKEQGLQTTSIPSTGDFTLPGNFFDIVPQNLIWKKTGGWVVIDREWHLQADIRFCQLVYRSLLILSDVITHVGKEENISPFEWGEVIRRVFSELHLDISVENISALLEFEGKVQASITGRSVVDVLQQWMNRSLPTRVTVIEHDSEINTLNSEINRLRMEREKLIVERDYLAAEREGMLNSISFKITKPLRVVRPYVVKAYSTTRRVLSVGGRQAWQALPISPQKKAVLKDKLFKTIPPQLLSWSRTYSSWTVVENDSWDDLPVMPASGNMLAAGAYVPLLQVPPPESAPVKLIAFYLPQFHAIAENNVWWGEGFTEWTNVKPAQPQFIGHYQPHVPDELGYYDLLDSSVQQRQVALARLYGVGGFCFYTYWFGGKLLLEKPVENYLKDRSLDLPFCLCWANENWSRRWDGLESELLMTQQHSSEDDLHFIQYVAQYMRDERYIRINGKPLLLVYRPSLLPSAKETAQRWREWCAQNGIGEIYLAYTQSFEAVNPRKYGFDAAIEFPPNNQPLPNIADTVKPLNERFTGKVYDWRAFVKRSRHYKKPAYPLFRSVCPAWDNTARRKHNGTIYINSSPEHYQEWLSNAVADTCKRILNPDERLVFVNAWNEWAEGAHLEPDQHYGYAYLEATRRALTNESSFNSAGKILVVSHDAHPHGAQFLALGMVRALKHDLHFDVEVVLLGGGRLEKEFAAFAKVTMLDVQAQRHEKLAAVAKALFQRGYTKAIVNTTVSGAILPAFKVAGIESVCLVHELPGVIQQQQLEKHTQHIATYAKAVVFPAQVVADGFTQFAAVNSTKQFIRPQGLYRRNKWRLEKALAKATLIKQLGVPVDNKMVLAVGYADHRKGVDLFVECALQIVAKRQDVDFIWIGHWEQEMQAQIEILLQNHPDKHRIHFVGFNPETALFHAASDVYALTSREDPFPNVVLESFDAGVPVVAFAGTGGASILVEQVGGIVVPALNVALFANAIQQLLDDAALSKRLGAAAQNHVDEHFAFRPYLFDLCGMLGVTLPKVSVIVPNYNYARYIEARLASICQQSIPVFELIVLDDASTDQSIPVISQWLAATQTEVRVVVNDANAGNVFAQWQKGIELASGDYIWIAEADDLSDPNFLATVLPPLVSGDVVLSYCDSQQISADGVVLAKNYQDYLSVVSADKWQQTYIANGQEECASSLAILNTIPNVSAVVFNSAVLKQVFHEHFDEIKSYQKAGDWMTYLHVLAQGNVAYSPAACNRHRRHDDSVIAGQGRQRLFAEIAQVQQWVATHYPLTDAVKLTAATYLDGLQLHG